MNNYFEFDGFKIVRPAFAHGSSSVVHEAVDREGRRIAIKVLDSSKVKSKIESLIKRLHPGISPESGEFKYKIEENYALYTERFRKEFQTLTQLSHPNIARVYKIGFFEEQLYIAYEFVDGIPIANYLRGKNPDEMVPFFIEGLSGLDYVHRSGLLHMDIKSDNVLVLETSHESRVTSHAKIIDFGLAITTDEYSGGFWGTPSYMAPEVALGIKELVDSRADLFSFAVVMYHCLTWGRFPLPRPPDIDRSKLRNLMKREASFQIRPPSYAHHGNRAFPEHLDKTVMRLLAHNPEDRFYGNARAVINALKTKSPDLFHDTSKTCASYLLPEGNRHVGREKEQGRLVTQILSFINNPDYQPPITTITGGGGIGKTHLLHKLSDIFSKHVESVFLNVLNFPASDATYNYWTESIDKQLAGKSKPVVLLIDDIHELVNQMKQCMQNSSALNMWHLIERAIGFAYSKHRTTVLLENIPSVFISLTLNKDRLSAKKMLELLGIQDNFVGEINLKPLTHLELDTYIKLTPAFKNKDVPGEWIDKLYKKTNGVPASIKEQLTEIDVKGMLFDLEGNIIINPLLPKARKSPPSTVRARLSETYSKCDENEKCILTLLSVWYFKNAAPTIRYNDIFDFLPFVFLRQKLVRLLQSEILTSDFDGKEYKFFNQEYFPSHIYNHLTDSERIYWHDKIAEYVEGHLKDAEFALLHRAFGTPDNGSFKAILTLGRKFLNERGNSNMSQELFEHGIQISGKNFRLRACFTSHALDTCLQENQYSKAMSLFENIKEGLNCRTGSRMWWIAILQRMTGIAISQRDYRKAESLIRETQKLIPSELSKTPISITLKNYQARYYYEMAISGHNSHREELLSNAKNIYQESEEMEAMLPAPARIRIRNNNLGLVLIALGKYEEAIFELEKKLARHEKEKNIFGILFASFGLADTYRLLRKYDSARKIAEKAARIANDTNQSKWLLHAHHVLANIAHDENRFREALSEDDARFACSVLLEDAREHHRTASEIWNHKGHCYKELGEYDKALLHFQAVIEGNGKDIDPAILMSTHEGLGEVYFLKNDYAKAINHLNIFCRISNTLPSEFTEGFRFPALNLKARSYLKSGRLTDAEGLLNELDALSRRNNKWLAEYGRLKHEIELARTIVEKTKKNHATYLDKSR